MTALYMLLLWLLFSVVCGAIAAAIVIAFKTATMAYLLVTGAVFFGGIATWLVIVWSKAANIKVKVTKE